MKRFKIYALCFALSLAFFGCKKEHLEPASPNGTPLFYFNGNINSTPVSLHAGVSNYYMYSSYAQDSNGVYGYNANLKEFGCTGGCASSIQFIINDYRSLAMGASEPNINRALAAGNYTYLTNGNTTNKYLMIFTPVVGTGSAAVTSFTFNYGDGTDTTGTTLPSRFTHIYSPFGHYSTSLFVTFADGNTSNLTLPLATQVSDTSTNAISSFLRLASRGGSTYALIDSLNHSVLNDTSQWNFGDPSSGAFNVASQGFSGQLDSTSHVFIDTASVHTITHIIVNSTTHDSVFSSLNMRVSSTFPQMDLINYHNSAPTLLPNPQNLSGVTIVYTDPSGHVYSSADSAQHVGSNFQVVSVAPYQNNENNQSTKQLHVKFNCTLYDGLGKSITITNGDAVIAAAYK